MRLLHAQLPMCVVGLVDVQVPHHQLGCCPPFHELVGQVVGLDVDAGYSELVVNGSACDLIAVLG